jgi:hypothetical protein
MDKETILEKLKANIPLSRDEEFFYLTEIIGMSKNEAERAIEISENQDAHTLID